MLNRFFPPPQDLIITTKDQTVINARPAVLAALVFCTLAFMVFIIVEYDVAVKRLGIGFWWVVFVLGAVSLFIGFSRLRDSRSLMIISKEGLSFPRLFIDILPWELIAEIKFTGSFMSVNFTEDLRLKWYPKFTLVPGDPGFPGDGFFSKFEVPWVKVRVNYQWPVTAKTLHTLIEAHRPK
ncbi:MAG: hypothetical protein ACO3MW_09045 [Rhodospirillales bacterium]|jgi:hypothetical protein